MDTDLWEKALYHLDKGNFTALEQMLGGPDGFDKQIIDWHGAGKFKNEPVALAEVFTCSCMLGRTAAAEYLLDNGVDPVAGMKTGLNGFHYSASGGRLDIVRLLIDRGVSMEIDNMYGGTVLGQALWSAVNEPKPAHAEIIEMLIDAGAVVEDGTLEWWIDQDIPNTATRQRVLDALQRHGAE